MAGQLKASQPVRLARTGISEGHSAKFSPNFSVTELGTALLTQNDDAVEALKEAVRTQVEELPLTVNVVAEEGELIERVLREAWWKAADDADLRDLVRRLGPLMKYRQRRPEPMVKLNLEDAVALKE